MVMRGFGVVGVVVLAALVAALVAACGEAEGACVSGSASGDPGALVWEQAFTAGAKDLGLAIGVDRCSEQVAVGGAIGGEPGLSMQDLWLGGLTRDGVPLWDRRINGAGAEGVAALAFAPDGTLRVAGWAGRDGWLASLDDEFAEQWQVRAVAGDAEESLHFGGLALGDAGELFVAGWRATNDTITAVAVAHDASGAVRWRYEREGDGRDSRLSDVFVLPDGELLLVGRSQEDGVWMADTLLVRLTPAGARVSEHHGALLPGVARGVALAGDGTSIYVVFEALLVDPDGIPGVHELSLTGELVHAAEFPPGTYPDDVAVGEGGVYVVGRVGRDGPSSGFYDAFAWVTRLDEALVPAWEHVLDRKGSARAVAVGPSGDAFVVGTIQAPPSEGPSDGAVNEDLWIARFAR